MLPLFWNLVSLWLWLTIPFVSLNSRCFVFPTIMVLECLHTPCERAKINCNYYHRQSKLLYLTRLLRVTLIAQSRWKGSLLSWQSQEQMVHKARHEQEDPATAELNSNSCHILHSWQVTKLQEDCETHWPCPASGKTGQLYFLPASLLNPSLNSHPETCLLRPRDPLCSSCNTCAYPQPTPCAVQWRPPAFLQLVSLSYTCEQDIIRNSTEII